MFLELIATAFLIRDLVLSDEEKERRRAVDERKAALDRWTRVVAEADRKQRQPSQAERPPIEIAEDWVWDLNWKYKAGFLLFCGIAIAIAA